VGARIVREDAGLLRLDIAGQLRKSEMDAAQSALVDALKGSQTDTARLLVVLQDFTGWEPGAAWNDLSFYMQHGDALSRIAIVGPERWRSEAMMFAAADLRKGPVEYFAPEALPAAREWLMR
jgi:hypothetical protein